MPVAIDKLSEVLRSCPHFDDILTLCSARKAYLVGGAIRDALIGRPITDLDFIFPEDPTSLAKAVAKQIGGHWFWLDKERLQSRVVVKRNSGCLHYDFALFRAVDLEGDLLDRDFTINALALPLTGCLAATSLVDVCQGLFDLQQSTLRMVGKDSFGNDPLRIVKGIRHATVLDLVVEPMTLRAMHEEAAGLGHVAPERIRQEVWKIFADQHAARGLQLLQESGTGEQLFGERFAGGHQALSERLESCRHLWRQLVQDNSVVGNWLTSEVEQGLNNEILLLWTFLLMSLERGLPAMLAEKWLFSRKARTNIAAVAGLDESALTDFIVIARNERAYTWWAARYRIDPKLLLLALAAIDRSASAPVKDRIRVFVPIAARLGDQRPVDLIDGHWLRNVLRLKEGPEMSKALEMLRNAEIFGEVNSTAEARQFLALHYQNRD